MQRRWKHTHLASSVPPENHTGGFFLTGRFVAEPPSPDSLLIPQDSFAFHFHNSGIVTSVTLGSAVHFSTLSTC